MNQANLSSPLKVFIICGDHNRSQSICNTLNKAGLDARIGDFTEPCDIYLFDLPSCSLGVLMEVNQFAKEYSRNNPLIATLGRHHSNSELELDVDIALSSDRALPLAKARFYFAQRTAARRAEVRLRQESYIGMGYKLPPSIHDTCNDILYVGEASGHFLNLKSSLETKNFKLTAAFSTSTAFDYLHDHSFSAVLLNTSAESINSDNFCAMVSRSSNLINLPILAFSNNQEELSSNILNCVTDLIDINSDMGNVSNQLIELVRNKGPSAEEFAAPNNEVSDTITGLFTRVFFESHLERQIAWSSKYAQSLSIIVIKVEGQNGQNADERDLSYTAKVMRTLLRIQDAPTRLDHSTLAVSMPGSSKTEAAHAARRIEGVLDATAFECEPDRPARQVRINWRIAELNQNQSLEQLLSTALLNFSNKDSAAA